MAGFIIVAKATARCERGVLAEDVRQETREIVFTSARLARG